MAGYRFWLAGEPVAQARPRIVRDAGCYYPAKSANYRKWAVLQLRNQLAGRPALLGPVKMGMLVYRVRPKSNKSEWPIVKPDLSNYLKMVEDALVDAGVLRDDSQICRYGDMGKFWVEDFSCGPGVEVVVEPVP
jgi:Holliday junction resolvase RusA-like endonuclease